MVTLNSPRATIMLVFAAFGASVGAWAGSIPHVTQAAGITNLDLGSGLMASTLCTIVVMALGGKIGRRVSNRTMMLWLLPALALLTAALLNSTSFPLFFVVVSLWGGVIGATDLFMNAEASAVEHDTGRPIFTAFHGAVSLSLAVLAIVSSYLTTLYGPMATSIAILPVMMLAWGLVYRNVPTRQLAKGREGGVSNLPSLLPLCIMGLIAGLSIAGETSAIFWSAKLLDEQAPRLAAITGLGAAFYGLCNSAMRFSGDYLRARFTDFPVMMASVIVAAAGFAMLGLSTNFSLSTIAFAAAGFGLAMICPCVFNMAAAQVPANRAAGLSFMSLVAGAPRVAAPWIFGWMATSRSTSFAFGLCSMILVVCLALTVFLQHIQSKRTIPASDTC
jgi:predicted MFS family arabinose efflux permease